MNICHTIQSCGSWVNQGNNLRNMIFTDITVKAEVYRVDSIYLHTKSFLITKDSIIFTGDKTKVLNSLDSLEKRNENEKNLVKTWFIN